MDAARSTAIPLLVVVAGDDLRMGVPELREAVEVSPAPTKRFVLAESGHGWDLATTGTLPAVEYSDIGRLVLAWIRGEYPTAD